MFKKLFQRSKPQQLKNQVELCVSNRIYDSEEIDTLLAREDIDIHEVGCNSQCETCDHHYYAIVNGETLAADSASELLQQIDEELTHNSVV
ncbi:MULTISPECIES: DUF1450 domain-containing protein [Bacillales]|uniref:DUF1450 domain-containing protein n=1 Tax=Lysinibacillus louembei TaxID=1470088 RepID=A0ABZ0RUZ5_9BACI|nr:MULTISPECIES: DUF1450 domain-containing protein [Bacillales]MCT6922897.1 YuzB family protein [Metasolibacillus sp.]MCT6939135.1 YuzB family protein [Metasolibacillus sp.]WPK11021.1 DUF1450 domain-containing protein [Lysinibacillus louembei]